MSYSHVAVGRVPNDLVSGGCNLVVDAARTSVERPGRSAAAVIRMSTVQILVINGFFERLFERVCFGHLG